MIRFFAQWIKFMAAAFGTVALFALFMLPIFFLWQIHPALGLVGLLVEVTGLYAADDVGLI